MLSCSYSKYVSLERACTSQKYAMAKTPTGPIQGKDGIKELKYLKLNRLWTHYKGLQNLYTSVRLRPAPPSKLLIPG
jgi:hypothetical protein